MSVVGLAVAAVERGWVPDRVTRAAIRRLCRARLAEVQQEESRAAAGGTAAIDVFCERLRQGPIALVPEKANEQHYELPAAFFELLLGPRLKYSCCWFEGESSTLAEAEEAALAKTAENAQLADGQEILELGCGWGSLSLWMAERYPAARITAVSNSGPQRALVERRAAERGLTNLRVITADMNTFETDAGRYDRVVSVEMFEHMHNYERLLERIASWLRDDGRLFVHWFCHRESAYAFGTESDDDWMGRYFFTGGLMPAENLLTKFDRDLELVERRSWNGDHYRRTAEAWLANLDARRDEATMILAGVYGRREAGRWFERWRMFLLAVAELFGYDGGHEWYVSHQLLRPVRCKRGARCELGSGSVPGASDGPGARGGR
jgi:cyclopropane-fatty-acyl-phospholipid synthase